jgi:hypothetical protein
LILSKSSAFEPVRIFVENMQRELRKKNKKYDEEGRPRVFSYPEKVSRCLGNMIRHNKSLQYLDLENTGLSHKVIADCIPNLARAKSLLSFHFGYNPGLDRQLKNLIKKKCHIGKK